MIKINMLAINLTKGSFQVCGVGADSAIVFNVQVKCVPWR